MTNQTTIKKYDDKFQVEKVAGFASLERRATFDFYKKITLAKSLLIGKHIAWYDGEGRDELAKCSFKFDFSKTSDGIVKTKKAGSQTDMHAANENCEFVHFAAHFYGVKKSDAYDARKIFKIEKQTVNDFLEQIQKDDNVLPMSNKGLIKFAKQLDAGVSAEEQNSDEAEKKEAKDASRKSSELVRIGANQYTSYENGDIEIKGDSDELIKGMLTIVAKIKMKQSNDAKKAKIAEKKKAKAESRTAEQQAKLDMETA